MFSYNIKFLTCDESVTLKNGDFKSYKYETKKKSEESVYDSGKRGFCERRGGHWTASKPRQLRQLEANFRDRTAVYCEWLNETLIGIVFSSGAIAYLTVKPDTLDVIQILFDRYIVGKLSGQSVTAVAFCKSHLLLTHTDRTATLVTFGKSLSSSQPCRIRDRDPHIQTVELGGSRRTERRISWCEAGTTARVLVWGATAIEPAPWSPVLEDHANIHLYQIKGQQISLLAYHQLENETLSAEFSPTNDNVIHIVEQTACHKSGVSLEWARYSVPLEATRATALRSTRVRRARCVLPAPARCVRRAARRLLAACIDGSLHVVHADSGLTHSARLGFVATDVRWAGSLLLAAEEGGRLQCLDSALAPLPHPAGCPHLGAALREPRRMHLLAARSGRGGPLVLASFGGGPLALLRISHPELITAWIRTGRPSNAVSLLRSLDWEQEGPACLRTLSALVCGALRGALGPEGEACVQAALGAYLAPQAPHEPNALKYSPAVHDLARKFFHHLLRRGRVEKALSLCVDLAAWDLCVDARWAAGRARLPALAAEAAAAAQACPESVCSDSCSQCSSSDSEAGVAARPPLPRGSDAATARPPLPRGSDVATARPPLPRGSDAATARPPLPRGSDAGVTARPPHPRGSDAGVTVRPPLPRGSDAGVTARSPASDPAPSIRPNLHQYIEKNNTIWNTDVREPAWSDYRKEPSVEVIPRPEPVHYRHLFQTELREEAPSTLYRYHGYAPERAKLDGNYERPKAEKNKVKFSDTVTIAVVASDSVSCPVARELAASLPLCAPHKYLAAFAPHPPPPPPPHPPHPPPPENAAQKPPKIKVVHFGMV